MMMALTSLCAVACIVLVAAEHRQHKRLRLVAKCIASLSFVLVGMLALREDHYGRSVTSNPLFLLWLGLIFGAIGDVALLGESQRAFMFGLVAFLFGHLLYVLSGSRDVVAPEWNDWVKQGSPYSLIPIVVGIGVLAWLWRRLGSMRVPVIIYVAVIVAMVVVAIDVGVQYEQVRPAGYRHRFMLGAILFFVSDLAVARDKFVQKSFWNRAWGLPTYYAAQLLIAWAIAGAAGD